MSVRKVEHWQLSWHDGRRPRSRKLKAKQDAEVLAREVEHEHAGRATVRRIDQWEVRWREGGRGSKGRQRTFDRKGDAQEFEREVIRRKQRGELGLWEQRNRTVRELAREWWAKYAVLNLGSWTLDKYERMLKQHVNRRLGSLRLWEVTPEVVADFRAQLERAGVGRDAVRVSMVVLQAMFGQAVAWRWIETNPVKVVAKPTARRERAVVCLAPARVERIRAWLIARDKLYAATIVSLIAYQGLRFPEEVLALEVRHVGKRTLLVEQRDIKGEIVAGQKVRGLHPRAIPWVEPARRDATEYLLATGLRSGLAIPARGRSALEAPRRGQLAAQGLAPCAQGGEDRADASLRPEARLRLAPDPGRAVDPRARLGHSPEMTVRTYTHVIRELEGEPRLSAEAQIERARRKRGKRRAAL